MYILCICTVCSRSDIGRATGIYCSIPGVDGLEMAVLTCYHVWQTFEIANGSTIVIGYVDDKDQGVQLFPRQLNEKSFKSFEVRID